MRTLEKGSKMKDDKIISDVCHYVALCTRFPDAPDWQAKVDKLWDYCYKNNKVHLYKRGYELAKEQVGL